MNPLEQASQEISAAIDTAAAGIKADIPSLQAVAKNMSRPMDSAQKAHGHVNATQLGDGAFGGSAEGRSFGTQHSNVRNVFQTTVAGLLDDLEAFKVNLQKSAEDLDNTDQAQQQALHNFVRRMDAHHYRSDVNYDNQRRQDGAGLHALPQHQQHGGHQPKSSGDQSGVMND